MTEILSMWFKNIYPFKLDVSKVDFDNLENELTSKPLVWPAPTQLETYGWVNAIGSNILHGVDLCILIRLGHHKRNLPAKVVNAEVAKRVKQIETNDDRKVGGKERTQIKEDVTFELLPKAFVESSYTDAWMDTKTGALYIDTPSAPKAEQFTKVLRSTLGSLPVTLPSYGNDIPTFLTNAIGVDQFGGLQNPNNEDRDVFAIQYNCKLEGGDKDTATYKNIDLQSESVTNGLGEGRHVTELGLSWNGRIEFTLTKDGVLKSVSFGEPLQVQMMETEIESMDQRRDTEFAIMSGEFRQLMSNLESDEVLSANTEF